MFFNRLWRYIVGILGTKLQHTSTTLVTVTSRDPLKSKSLSAVAPVGPSGCCTDKNNKPTHTVEELVMWSRPRTVGSKFSFRERFYGWFPSLTRAPDLSMIMFKHSSTFRLLSSVSTSPISRMSWGTVEIKKGASELGSNARDCSVVSSMVSSSYIQTRYVTLTPTHSRKAAAAVSRTTVSASCDSKKERTSQSFGSLGVPHSSDIHFPISQAKRLLIIVYLGSTQMSWCEGIYWGARTRDSSHALQQWKWFPGLLQSRWHLSDF